MLYVKINCNMRILFFALLHAANSLRHNGAIYMARNGSWYFHNRARVRLNRISEDPEGGIGHRIGRMFQNYGRTCALIRRCDSIEQPQTAARNVLCTD